MRQSLIFLIARAFVNGIDFLDDFARTYHGRSGFLEGEEGEHHDLFSLAFWSAVDGLNVVDERKGKSWLLYIARMRVVGGRRDLRNVLSDTRCEGLTRGWR
jgi:hypothetical protein